MCIDVYRPILRFLQISTCATLLRPGTPIPSRVRGQGGPGIVQHHGSIYPKIWLISIISLCHPAGNHGPCDAFLWGVLHISPSKGRFSVGWGPKLEVMLWGHSFLGHCEKICKIRLDPQLHSQGHRGAIDGNPRRFWWKFATYQYRAPNLQVFPKNAPFWTPKNWLPVWTRVLIPKTKQRKTRCFFTKSKGQTNRSVPQGEHPQSSRP